MATKWDPTLQELTLQTVFHCMPWRFRRYTMQPLTVELIPDPELDGFTARVPDIPAYGERGTEEEAILDFKQALVA